MRQFILCDCSDMAGFLFYTIITSIIGLEKKRLYMLCLSLTLIVGNKKGKSHFRMSQEVLNMTTYSNTPDAKEKER